METFFLLNQCRGQFAHTSTNPVRLLAHSSPNMAGSTLIPPSMVAHLLLECPGNRTCDLKRASLKHHRPTIGTLRGVIDRNFNENHRMYKSTDSSSNALNQILFLTNFNCSARLQIIIY